MKTRLNHKFFLLLTSILFLIFTGGCTTTRNKTVIPDNFYQVSPGVYRSGQPSKDEMQQLAQLGIKTIINLRAIHSDRDEVEGTGLNAYWVRMSAGNITDKKMIEVLRLINQSPKPILIHCWHGSDRTGVTIAMYRMVFQNWSRQAVIDELMLPEYGHHYNYYPNIVKYLRNVDVDVDDIKQQVFQVN